jgi:hypothetical protein
MIVVTARGTGEPELAELLERLRALGLAGQVLRAGPRPLIHVTGGDSRRTRRLLALESVRALVPTSGPRVRRAGRRFYPYHALRAGAAGLVLLGLLVFLAGYFPPGVGRAPVPGEVLPPVQWPWYLAPLRGLLALAPARPAWLGPSLLVLLTLVVLALPLLDRTRGERAGQRWPVLVIGLALLAALVVLGLLSGNR